MLTPATPIGNLNRVGRETEAKLKRLEIYSVHDLIWYLPIRYDDLSELTTIKKITSETRVTIRGTIKKISSVRSFRKRIQITKAILEDETGTLPIIWFGQRFIDKNLSAGDEVFISGAAKQDLTGFTIVNPVFEKVKATQLHTARIIPFYRLTSGVSQKQLRFLIASALDQLDELPDAIPPRIIAEEKLMGLSEALRSVHYPESDTVLARAIERLKFEELFWLQLRAEAAKESYRKHIAPKMEFSEESISAYVSGLPFSLTGDQRKAAWQVLRDMEREQPMNRLIEGDVGSGKTVVASIAILNALLNGYQSALMAPTELLAQQHYRELRRLLNASNPRISSALMTSTETLLDGTKVKKEHLYEALAADQVHYAVGTHSLIQDGVRFHSLGLAIIDEQHRFGVDQRKNLTELSAQTRVPHLLSLTATPIPRTLALTLYGDLDISIIKEKPRGRKPIITRLVVEENRKKAYGFIREKIQKGQQVFILCPLIDESDISETKSVTAETELLRESVFPDLDIRSLHGKMKPLEKQRTLQDFRDKKFPILVTTSVIEVGIDIPNATIMVIEGAERFGLAQLHQFRGRVGRGDQQSYCLLFSGSRSEASKKRLKLMTEHSDGFLLAEKDLQLRGEGDLFGTKQSGLVQFSIATIHDTDLITRSKKWVRRIIEDSESDLRTDAIKNKLRDVAEIHRE